MNTRRFISGFLVLVAVAAMSSLGCPDDEKPDVDGLDVPPPNIPTGPSGTFLQVGGMYVARQEHGAIRLITGDVLVAGGRNAANPALASGEIYKYTQGTFLMAPYPMNTARYGFTMTALSDNKVVICGGRNTAGAAVQSAEVFDPSAYSFTATTSSPVSARAGHAALLLPNGNIFVCGGYDGTGNAITSCEVFDPQTSLFTLTDNDMLQARALHSVTLLRNSKILIAGGVDSSGNAVTAAEIFDPGTGSGLSGTFTSTGPLPSARAGHVAAIVNTGAYDGQVALFGGFSGAAASPSALSTAAVFDPAANSFAGGFFGCVDFMASARLGHTATILSGGTGVLIVGGNNLNLPEVFDPDFGTSGLGAWSDGDFKRTASSAPANTSMVAVTSGRTRHAAEFLINGTILICGGEDGGTVIDTAEIYNP